MARLRAFSLALLAALWTAPALADVEASVGLVSDYVNKGISDSDGHAAFQGSVTWMHGTGFFLGLDGTTVDYNDGTDAELAFSGGYQWQWDDVTLAAGITRTHYTGAPKGAGLDLWEFGLTGHWDMGETQGEAEFVYSPDDGGAGDALYQRLALTVPLVDRVSITPHIAHQWYQRKDVGGPAYWHYGADLSYDWDPATFGVAFTDTSLDQEAGCLCGARVSAYVTVTFQ